MALPMADGDGDEALELVGNSLLLDIGTESRRLE
jgi:hypothetical protein